MTYIDSKSKRIVAILYQSQTQDADGDYGSASETTRHAEVICDIQPWTGDLEQDVSGPEAMATHVMFPEQDYTEIAVHDVVRDGSTDYEVLFVYDYRDCIEILLRKI